jgi:hypothetical protein
MKGFSQIVSEHLSDKISLGYGPVYDSILKNLRLNSLTILEVGVGTMIPNVPSTMVNVYGENGVYKPGASLRAFTEYFPNAMVYGADIQDDCIFEEDRIKTFKFDSTDLVACNDSLQDLQFDIIIDDGLHTTDAQVKTFRNLWSRVKPGGYYFIEDVWPPLRDDWSIRFSDIQAEKFDYKNKDGHKYSLIVFSK